MKVTEVCVGITLAIVTLLTDNVGASLGDRSPFFNKCCENCRNYNCTPGGISYKPKVIDVQALIDKVLLWECSDECQYECMWKTVDAFKGRNWEIPQFYGKWPFMRIFGIQELGSVVGSILNLVAHVVNNIALRKNVPSSHPMYWLWQVFFWISLHTWVWSIIFHTRDVWFTEFMDYACAFSMVVFTFYCFGMRVLQGKSKKWGVILACFCASYYANHVFYLFSGRIDYEYNMIANIIAGVLGGVGWATWSCVQLWRGKVYVWRCLAYVLLVGASMLLELGDFPPKFQLWDAHAIWHLSTAPLPFLFYRFIIDDCKHTKKRAE